MEAENTYAVYQQLDSHGEDIKYVGGLSVEQLKELCELDPTCIAFNTFGFLKHTVNTLKGSEYYGKCGDLYVHKGRYEKLIHIPFNIDECNGNMCFIDYCTDDARSLNMIIDHIIDYKLIDVLDKIYIICDNDEPPQLYNNNPKIGYHIVRGQYSARNIVWKVCRLVSDVKVLHLTTLSGNKLDYLLHCLVDNWRHVFTLNYDVVGTSYMNGTTIKPRFDSTCYWSHSDYIAQTNPYIYGSEYINDDKFLSLGSRVSIDTVVLDRGEYPPQHAYVTFDTCIYTIWTAEIIKADHDDYCSDADNEEEISNGVYIVKHYLSSTSLINTVNWIQMNNISSLKVPYPTQKDDYDHDGSGYCNPSEHGLKHATLSTPIILQNIVITRNNVYDSIDYHDMNFYLKKVQQINAEMHIILSLFGIPSEVIDSICVFVWK